MAVCEVRQLCRGVLRAVRRGEVKGALVAARNTVVDIANLNHGMGVETAPGADRKDDPVPDQHRKISHNRPKAKGFVAPAGRAQLQLPAGEDPGLHGQPPRSAKKASRVSLGAGGSPSSCDARCSFWSSRPYSARSSEPSVRSTWYSTSRSCPRR